MFGLNQLQAWPTPEMFIRRTGGGLTETVSVNINLSAFEAVQGQTANAGSDTSTASLSLSSMLVNGPQPVNVGDDVVSAIVLSDFVNVLPITFPLDTEIVTVNLALGSFAAVTAQTGTTKTDEVSAAINLSAFVIP